MGCAAALIEQHYDRTPLSDFRRDRAAGERMSDASPRTADARRKLIARKKTTKRSTTWLAGGGAAQTEGLFRRIEHVRPARRRWSRYGLCLRRQRYPGQRQPELAGSGSALHGSNFGGGRWSIDGSETVVGRVRGGLHPPDRDPVCLSMAGRLNLLFYQCTLVVRSHW